MIVFTRFADLVVARYVNMIRKTSEYNHLIVRQQVCNWLTNNPTFQILKNDPATEISKMYDPRFDANWEVEFFLH